MKVIMVDSLIGNNYTFNLCEGLAISGADVTLVTTQDNADRAHPGYDLLPASPPKSQDVSVVIKLAQYVRYLIWLFFYIARSDADVVHYQFFRRKQIECLYFPLLRLLRPQLVFTAHNLVPHENTKLDYVLRQIVYSASSDIIVHTDGIKQNLLKTFRVNNPNKVHVVPAVQATAAMPDDRITQAMARNRFNLPDDAKILLFFGYIRAYKGVDLLLDAFEQVRPKHENLMLVIAGNPHSDELHEKYQKQIEAMHYQDDVVFRAEFIPEDDVPYYFRAADAIAMPYTSIDFSGIMNEAFRYGLPALATHVGNFAEVIDNGINGYVTDENTVEELARIIDKAFADKAHLQQMGQQAYDIEMQKPSIADIGSMTLTIYQKHSSRQGLQESAQSVMSE